MKNNANYLNKIIHLADLSHKDEKMMFPSATKFKDHSKDERWALDTCNKTKKVIGCILFHQKMAKILREYSDQSDYKYVRFHTFQPFMNVIFCEYLSISLNSLLENLNVMMKALPDIIPDDSIDDAVTQDVGKQILKTIKDRVFFC